MVPVYTKKRQKKKTAMYRKLPGATKAKGLGASAQAAPKVLWIHLAASLQMIG